MFKKIFILFFLCFSLLPAFSRTVPAYDDYKIIRIVHNRQETARAPGLYILHRDMENRFFTASEHKNILGWRINPGDILLITNPGVEVFLSDGKSTVSVKMKGQQKVVWESPVRWASFFYEPYIFFDDYGYKKSTLLEENPALFKGRSLVQTEKTLEQNVRALADKRKLTAAEFTSVLNYSVLLQNSGGIEAARAVLENFLLRAKLSPDKRISGQFYSQLGDIYLLAGHINRALFLYKQMIDKRFALYQDKPYETDYAIELIIGYLKLGISFNSGGDKKNALIYYKKALNIHKKISLLEKDEKLQELLVLSYLKMGDALLYLEASSIKEKNENMNQALQSYRQATALVRESYNSGQTAHRLLQLLYTYDRTYNYYYETGNAQAESVLTRQIQLIDLFQKENKEFNYYIETALLKCYIKLITYYTTSSVPGLLEKEEFVDLQNTLDEDGKRLLYEQYLFDSEMLQYKLGPRVSEENMAKLIDLFSTSGVIVEKKLKPAFNGSLALLGKLEKMYAGNMELLEFAVFIKEEYAKIVKKQAELITIQAGILTDRKELFAYLPENFNKFNSLMQTFSRLTALYEQKNEYQKILSLLEDQNRYQQRGLGLYPDNSRVREEYVNISARIVRLYMLLGNNRNALTGCRDLYTYTKDAAGKKGKTKQDIRNYTIVTNLLGDVYAHKSSHDKAMEYYEEALEYRDKHYNKEKDAYAVKDLSISYNKVADAYVQLGEYDKALEYYTKSLKLLETASKNSSRSTRTTDTKTNNTDKKRTSRFKNRRDKNKSDTDKKDQATVTMAVTGSTDYQVQIEKVYMKMGTLYFKQGKMNEAYSHYGKSLDIIQKLLAKKSGSSHLLEDQVIVLSKLANIDIQQKKWDPGLTKLDDASRVITELYKNRKNNTALQLIRAIVLVQQGDIYFTGKNNLDEAKKYYTRAEELLTGLYRLDRENIDRAYDLSALYYKLGNLNRRQGQATSAFDYYEKYEQIESGICKRPGIEDSRKFDLSLVYNYLGDISYNTRDYKRAVKYYGESIALREQLYENNKENSLYLEALTVTYSKQGTAYYLLKQYKSALSFYEKDANLSKEYFEKNKTPETALMAANALYNLGVVTQKTAGLEAGGNIIKEAKEILLKHKSSGPEYTNLLKKMQ